MSIQRIIPPILIIFACTSLALSFMIEGQKVTDFSSAAFMPAVISFIMVICSLLIAKRGIAAPSLHSINNANEEEGQESLVEIEEITSKQVTVRILSFLLIVILFAFLMNYLNFLLISFLFLLGAMLLLNRKKIVMALVITTILSICFYYLFSIVFKIVFPV